MQQVVTFIATEEWKCSLLRADFEFVGILESCLNERQSRNCGSMTWALGVLPAQMGHSFQ